MAKKYENVVSGDKYVYTLFTSKNVSSLISNSEVVATEVYDNNSKKRIKRITPLLIKADNFRDFLAEQLIIKRISEMYVMKKLLINSTHALHKTEVS